MLKYNEFCKCRQELFGLYTRTLVFFYQDSGLFLKFILLMFVIAPKGNHAKVFIIIHGYHWTSDE